MRSDVTKHCQVDCACEGNCPYGMPY
jgi:hypothetical protein